MKLTKKAKKEIEKRYNRLLEQVETQEFYIKIDLTDRMNSYTCKSCLHITTTKDIDKGVTPMFFDCEKCGRRAVSSFYNDVYPEMKPTWEWYRPTLKKLLKLSVNDIEHVLLGGLLPKRIK